MTVFIFLLLLVIVVVVDVDRPTACSMPILMDGRYICHLLRGLLEWQICLWSFYCPTINGFRASNFEKILKRGIFFSSNKLTDLN